VPSPESKKQADFDILIVDDEKDFSEAMQYWFKSQGYNVKTVGGGNEAIELLKTQTPAIIFMDILMPGMDGLQALKAIRELKIEVPVVIMTSHDSEEMRLYANQHGVNAFLDKTRDFYTAEHIINSLVRIVAKKKD